MESELSNINIICGDALEELKKLPRESVHCCVTSPPYWGLRDYGIEGQYGLEETPAEYVSKMVEVFREVWRVLRLDGTLWLNVGDTHYTGKGKCRNPGGGAKSHGKHLKAAGALPITSPNRMLPKEAAWAQGLKPKDLVGIPWMLAFALRADGWWLRSDVIWAKKNPMPDSTKDRPGRSHEHVFLMTKSDFYYYDWFAVREEAKSPIDTKSKQTFKTRGGKIEKLHGNRDRIGAWMPNGYRNRRDVWHVSTKPYPGAHYAVFPEELIEPCIKAGTSEKGCCPTCGAGMGRIVEPSPEYAEFLGTSYNDHSEDLQKGLSQPHERVNGQYVTTGWDPRCVCADSLFGSGDPIPSTVLDPFNGHGTTGLASKKYGRSYIGIELNPADVEATRERLSLNTPEAAGLE